MTVFTGCAGVNIRTLHCRDLNVFGNGLLPDPGGMGFTMA